LGKLVRGVVFGAASPFFDRVCVACGAHAEDLPICKRCADGISFLKGELNIYNKRHYRRLFSAVSYDGPVPALIKGIKYSKRRDAELLLDLLIRDELLANFSEIDAVVAVPSDPFRFFMRGYNPAGVIASHVAKRLRKPLLMRAVTKRRTPPQVGLSLAKRKENVRGAFYRPYLFPNDVEGRHILLVDDVETSGATLDNCAMVLKRSGAGVVDALTLARAL